MSKKHWIQKAIKHPGALHKSLGIAKGKKIPVATLKRAASGNGMIAKRARLAMTLMHMHRK